MCVSLLVFTGLVGLGACSGGRSLRNSLPAVTVPSGTSGTASRRVGILSTDQQQVGCFAGGSYPTPTCYITPSGPYTFSLDFTSIIDGAEDSGFLCSEPYAWYSGNLNSNPLTVSVTSGAGSGFVSCPINQDSATATFTIPTTTKLTPGLVLRPEIETGS